MLKNLKKMLKQFAFKSDRIHTSGPSDYKQLLQGHRMIDFTKK